MVFRQYRDFILVADHVRPPQGPVELFNVSVFDSPVGQGEKKEEVRVPKKLNLSLRLLENRHFDDRLSHQIELGEVLGSMLLPPYARALFAESLNHLPEHEGLRIRLRLHDRLADFPWEYAYVQRTRDDRTALGFLALDPRISIVRHEALAVPGDWFGAPSRRRVLVAMASPPPYDQYRKLEFLPREQHEIRHALSKLAGIDAVFVPLFEEKVKGEFPSATIQQLTEALIEGADIFHFSGHGEFDRGLTTQEDNGALILADSKGEAFHFSSTALAEMLRSKNVRLAVLGACEGGRRDGQNVWSGVAAVLLSIGIPAVVAMQYTISDSLAAAFSVAFYRALVAGYTVDEAVGAGRTSIRLEAAGTKPHVRDWGVPVLYLRAATGTIFRPVDSEAARTAGMRATGQLIEQRVREMTSKGRMIGIEADVLRTGNTITIDQKVEQEAAGLMVGGRVVRLEGGHLTVRMHADRLTGTMIGAQLGGRRDSESQDELAELENLVRLK